MITVPDGDIAEDRIVTAVGSYSASATLSGAGAWIMQMVAFKAAGGVPDTTPPTAPTALAATANGSSGINLSWTASTDNVAVTGYRMERCQGAGCSTLCADRDADRDDLRRHRSAGGHELQLPGAGDRCAQAT